MVENEKCDVKSSGVQLKEVDINKCSKDQLLHIRIKLVNERNNLMECLCEVNKNIFECNRILNKKYGYVFNESRDKLITINNEKINEVLRLL